MNAPNATAVHRPPPDSSTAFAMIAIAEVQALLLYLAFDRHGQGGLFGDRAFLTLWYSVLLIPPAVISVQLRHARDGYAWLSGLAVAALVALLAWHTGAACGNDEAVHCDSVIGPYVASLAIGSFILMPFIQGFRDHGMRIPYASLFHDAWDNALTLGAVGVFTGAAWLILMLWAALFDMVGIEFFKRLFQFEGFIYPVTGLMVGSGMVLARSQAGALQAVLRVCLTLGRALLPLISVLAVVFLATLISTGLQPLWDTRQATTLLLLLILGTVSLVNSVLHDGSGVDTYRISLRRLMGAALLTLPVYAMFAAIGLSMRVSQYGWTVDRLWAAVLVFITTTYTFTYAFSAVVRRQGRWLGFLPAANTLVALAIVAVLFATQSPLLDLRAITVASQVDRFRAFAGDVAEFDYKYFRWELGLPGVEALRALESDPRVKGSAAAARTVRDLLEAKERWHAPGRALNADELRVLPAGQAIPEGLLEAMDTRGLDAGSCDERACVLVAADLLGGAEPEWMLLQSWAPMTPVYALRNGRWVEAGAIESDRQALDVAVREALRTGEVTTQPAERRDLVIGGARLAVRPK